MRKLKKFEMIKYPFISEESETNLFPLSKNVNKRFRIAGSRDTKIFDKSNHIFKVRRHKEFDNRFKVRRFFVIIFSIKDISFIISLLRSFRVNKNISNFIFKRNNIWNNRIFMMVKKFLKVIVLHDGIIFRIFKDKELGFFNFPIKLHQIIFRKLCIIINSSIIEMAVNVLHNMVVIELNFTTFTININNSWWKRGIHITDNAPRVKIPQNL